jgi:hypothetical protein
LHPSKKSATTGTERRACAHTAKVGVHRRNAREQRRGHLLAQLRVIQNLFRARFHLRFAAAPLGARCAFGFTYIRGAINAALLQKLIQVAID